MRRLFACIFITFFSGGLHGQSRNQDTVKTDLPAADTVKVQPLVSPEKVPVHSIPGVNPNDLNKPRTADPRMLHPPAHPAKDSVQNQESKPD